MTAIYSWGRYMRAEPGWQRVKGVIEKEKIVIKLGIPPHDATIYLSTRDGKTAYVESVEEGTQRRGWFDKKQ